MAFLNELEIKVKHSIQRNANRFLYATNFAETNGNYKCDFFLTATAPGQVEDLFGKKSSIRRSARQYMSARGTSYDPKGTYLLDYLFVHLFIYLFTNQKVPHINRQQH